MAAARIFAAALAGAALAAAEPIRLPAVLCCTRDFERGLVLDTGELPAAAVTAHATPDGLVALAARVVGEHRLELRLQAKGEGRGALELRDAGAGRLAGCPVQVVAMTTDATRSIGSEASLPDGSVIFAGQLILTPHVPGLDVRFACLSDKVTVPDGLSERWVASETFTPQPDGSSKTTFRMLRAPKARWVPFTYVLYQDGEQIGAP